MNLNKLNSFLHIDNTKSRLIALNHMNHHMNYMNQLNEIIKSSFSVFPFPYIPHYSSPLISRRIYQTYRSISGLVLIAGSLSCIIPQQSQHQVKIKVFLCKQEQCCSSHVAWHFYYFLRVTALYVFLMLLPDCYSLRFISLKELRFD